MGLTAHKAYNTTWYCTFSKNRLRPLMREKQESTEDEAAPITYYSLCVTTGFPNSLYECDM